jgi:hypothetical protein
METTPKVVTMVVTLPPAPTRRMALAALALAFPFSLRMATWFPWTMTQAFALSLGMATWFPWTMTQAFALSLRMATWFPWTMTQGFHGQ